MSYVKKFAGALYGRFTKVIFSYYNSSLQQEH